MLDLRFKNLSLNYVGLELVMQVVAKYDHEIFIL